MKKILIIFGAAILCGCASTGTNFKDANVSEIQKGETTETQLISLFGQPNQRTINSDNGTTLSWIYVQSTVKGTTFIPIFGAFDSGVNTKNKSLIVNLDPSGMVTNFTYSGGTMGASTTIQSTPK